MKDNDKNILLAAGGTGGHLYGAESLASELSLEGYNTFLFTDKRVGNLVKGFAQDNVKEIFSDTFTNKSFYKWPFVVFKILLGFISSLILIKKINPKAVVGFGGYPTIPVILAAKLCGSKIIIHEQNIILGRANKLLVKLADIITLGFDNTIGVPKNYRKKTFFSGNPIRRDILKYQSPYEAFNEKDKFNLVIFGGSQGASFFSKTIPPSLCMLSDKKKSFLKVFHQVRPEEVESVKNFYNSENINAEVSYFFDNLPVLLNSSHLIISRSGASTVSEISAIKRPAILIPFPDSIDSDQKLNALNLQDTGQVVVCDQKDVDSEWFFKKINELIDSPNTLKEMIKITNSKVYNDGAQNITKLIKNFEVKVEN